MPTEVQDEALRGYLLGELAEAQAAALEARYFAEPELQERIRGVELELVDDFVAGRLEPDLRAAFERGYLVSDEHRQRVAVARALRQRAAVARGTPVARWSRRAPLRLGLAIAAGLLVAVGVARWLRPAPPAAPGDLSAVTRPPAGASTPAAGAAPQVPEPIRPPVVLAFTLSPLHLRAAGETRLLRLAPDAGEVLLRLEGEERPRGALRFTLRTVGGTVLATGPASPATPPGLVALVSLPASSLRPDDYLLTLSGGGDDDAASYFFRVARP
jgi:hypothetical protein